MFAFFVKCDIITSKMIQQHKNILASLSGQLLVSLALASIVGIYAAPKGSINPEAFLQGPIGGHAMVARTPRGEEVTPNTPVFRQARRLQKRLRKSSYLTPSIRTLAAALERRKILLGRTVSVTLTAPDRNEFPAWEVSLNRYPTWLAGTFTSSDASFDVSTERIQSYLKQNGIDGVSKPTTSVITDLTEDEHGILRVNAESPAKPGYAFDENEVAAQLQSALALADPTMALSLERDAGRIVNETGQDLGALQLIAEGRSNFAGSVPGRIANVKKGLKERTNNVLVPPGATFSFNKTLGPVTARMGWYEALGIFNGDELRPVTGGGICQVATTMYRAMLLAGLPVMSRKPHSLYVSYYEKYAVGIDATVYPGQQDLTFTNDTQHYLLVQSYSDGFEATVNIYGTADGRTVEMEGPYFAKTAPEDLTVNERKIAKNEIAWRQHITHVDGVTQVNTIVSRYKFIPTTVVKKYTEQVIATGAEEKVHTAAPDQLSMRKTF